MNLKSLILVGLMFSIALNAEENKATNIYMGAVGKIAVHLNNISTDKKAGLYYQQQKELLKSDDLSFSDRSVASQYTATYASFIGDYKFAIEEFDRHGTMYREVSDQVYGKDAIEYLVKAAAQHKIVMVNEAHHVPAHRWLTYALLKDLKEQGFEYLALETLSEEGEDFIDAHSVYQTGSGFYSNETFFIGLINHAIELGYNLVSYDQNGQTIEERDRLSAEVIKSKVFDKNPNAKVIFHVGYDHIDESKYLAFFLKERTGINPLTVNQSDFCSGCNTKLDQSYDSPVVLLSNDKPWIPAKANYDIAVYWPKDHSTHERGGWYFSGFGKAKISNEICQNSFPCFIEVETDYKKSKSYVDRFLVQESTDEIELRYRTLNDMITSYGSEGELIRKTELSRLMSH